LIGIGSEPQKLGIEQIQFHPRLGKLKKHENSLKTTSSLIIHEPEKGVASM